jgi:cyclase
LDVIKEVSASLKVPLIASGGAGTLEDAKQAILRAEASAAAAGAMFVFHGKHQAVLITYPSRAEIEQALTPT